MLFFGLDIGSTNIKSVLLDRDGRLLDRTNIASATQSNQTDEALTWYEMFCRSLDYYASEGKLRKQETICCCVAAQGGSFTIVDADLKPLLTSHWTERKSDHSVEDLLSSHGNQSYYHTTGWEPANWLAVIRLKECIVPATVCLRKAGLLPRYLISSIPS